MHSCLVFLLKLPHGGAIHMNKETISPKELDLTGTAGGLYTQENVKHFKCYFPT